MNIAPIPPPVDTFRYAVNHGSTLMARFWISVAAILQAVGYAMGGPGGYAYVLYAGLNALVPLWMWSLAYFVVGIAGFWRVFDSRSSPRCAWIVNTLTFFVWVTGLVVRLKLAPVMILTTYAVVTVMALWCLLRTEATFHDTTSA